MGRWDQSAWATDDLIGGHAALDFTNTAGGRTKARDVERLTDYATFLKWATAADILTAEEAEILQRQVSGDQRGARAELADVVRFREAVHSCLMAEQAQYDWPEKDRAQVMVGIREALLEARLTKDGARYKWNLSGAKPHLSLPRHRLALATEDLLCSHDLGRLRNCDRCSWLFIDRGRGRARRWCSMAACGSRTKSARYYERQKTGRP